MVGTPMIASFLEADILRGGRKNLGKGWKKVLSVFREREPDFLPEEWALVHAPQLKGAAFLAAGRHGLSLSHQDPVRQKMGHERGLTCLKTDSDFGSQRLLGSQHSSIQARLHSEHRQSWDSRGWIQALIVNIERVFPTRLLVTVGRDGDELMEISTALLGNGKQACAEVCINMHADDRNACRLLHHVGSYKHRLPNWQTRCSVAVPL